MRRLLPAALGVLSLIACTTVERQRVGRVTCTVAEKFVYQTDSLGWYDAPRIGTAFNEPPARASWRFRKWTGPNRLGPVTEVSSTAVCIVEGADE